jgi:uncharacterized protein with FMN-binding domain
MRPLAITLLVIGSTATLAGAWLVGQPRLIEAIDIAAQLESPASVHSERPTSTATESAPASSAPARPITDTVDGSIVTTKYGTVQVQAVITDGVLTDVIATKLTDSSDTSIALSAKAAPLLREQVLAAQSTVVDTVSGATYTSEAYLTSLQAALDAAGL